jgi:hypothetical protein
MADKSSKQREEPPKHATSPRRDQRHDDDDTRIAFTSWDCALVPDDSRG